MSGKNPDPISLEQVKTYPLNSRESKVKVDSFARLWEKGGSFDDWLHKLPGILAAKDLKDIVSRIIRAVHSQKTILLGMGAHPIKVGLSPIIIDLMERGVISGIAMNGACIIHDTEVAMVGHTSEDVASELSKGTFGMAEETGRFLNQVIVKGAKQNLGLGESIGIMLVEKGFPYNEVSILARAYELNVPVTVHVAVGTDIIHCHPTADGAAVGRTSHLDFRIFATLVSRLEGGVFINLGSAVIIPEVFLKALSLVRNLGFRVQELTTVNMDFIKQYRPLNNVVSRPTLEGGVGFNLVGHHEIMFPLIASAIIEGLDKVDLQDNG